MAPQDFAAAFESLTAGTSSDESKKVLERHLREDERGVREYVEQLRLHALLTWSQGAVAPGISLPTITPPAKPRSVTRMWFAGIATLAASLLLCVGVMNWPAQAPAKPALATIVASEDAARFAVGKQLEPGPLTLGAGELQITFASGTKVTLQGPIEAELIDDMTLRVTRGQVTAKLQAGGRQGFTIRTPTADVIDLSTEFGVAVESSGETDVVVFEGSVDVVSKAAAPTTTRLLRGEALSVAATRATSRLVSIQREAGHKNWTGHRRDQAGIISAVSDNLLDPTNRKCYQIVRAGLADGTTAYVDRDYTWQDVPEILRGADYVMTFNDDKRQPDLSLEIQIYRPTRLYVLVDDRKPAPAWLSESGFDKTNAQITLSETGPQLPRHPFSIWQKRISTPGLVKLGANQAKAMYAVAAVSEKVRVACLGDSITAGSGYVNELQSWLSTTHEVKNFGVSGATLLAAGDKPYTKEKAYQQAIEYKPEIVTLMLGTNDTKPQNYRSIANFAADCRELLAPFLKQEPRPKIYLCLPVPVYFEGNFGIDQGRLTEGVLPAIKSLAKDLNLPIIDIHTPLLNRPDLFHRDNVHPLGGATNLAAPIYETLTGNKPPVAIPPAPTRALRLACLGDSITEGSGYTSALQQLLGNRVMVKNYGVSGSTLLSKGDKPYTKQSKFAAAEAFEPNAVILMLGTNDTKPKNYEQIPDFEKELTELCATLSTWKSQPKILLALPVPVIGEGNFGIDNQRLEEGVLPAIRNVAKARELLLIDMNTALKPHRELFKDRIHPNGAQSIMAKAALGPFNEAFPLPTVKENLLKNPGAEEGKTDWGVRGGTLEIVNDPITAGKSAFKVSQRTAGHHGPAQNVTAAVKAAGMGYYQLRGSVRLAKGSTEATLVVIIKDARGMRYCKTPNRTINSDGWVDFADDVFLGWTGELQEATFCIETNGALETDMWADDLVLNMSVNSRD